MFNRDKKKQIIVILNLILKGIVGILNIFAKKPITALWLRSNGF